MGWLASRASGVKRGNQLRTSELSKVAVVVTVPVRKPWPRGAPGDEADADFLAGGQDFGFGVSCPQGVLALQGGDGLDGVGAAEGLRARL